MKILVLLSLLFLSCSKQSHWAFDQVHSDKKEFRSTKLTYYSHDPVSGVDLELLKTDEHLNVYLNIHSIPIAPYQGDPKKALLTLEIEGEKTRCFAYRLSGGQRFLLPVEVAESVIEALHHHKEVSIALVGYRTLYKPEDFSAKFQKLLHPFPFQNPFELPM